MIQFFIFSLLMFIGCGKDNSDNIGKFDYLDGTAKFESDYNFDLDVSTLFFESQYYKLAVGKDSILTYYTIKNSFNDEEKRFLKIIDTNGQIINEGEFNYKIHHIFYLPKENCWEIFATDLNIPNPMPVDIENSRYGALVVLRIKQDMSMEDVVIHYKNNGTKLISSISQINDLKLDNIDKKIRATNVSVSKNSDSYTLSVANIFGNIDLLLDENYNVIQQHYHNVQHFEFKYQGEFSSINCSDETHSYSIDRLSKEFFNYLRTKGFNYDHLNVADFKNESLHVWVRKYDKDGTLVTQMITPLPFDHEFNRYELKYCNIIKDKIDLFTDYSKYHHGLQATKIGHLRLTNDLKVEKINSYVPYTSQSISKVIHYKDHYLISVHCDYTQAITNSYLTDKSMCLIKVNINDFQLKSIFKWKGNRSTHMSDFVINPENKSIIIGGYSDGPITHTTDKDANLGWRYATLLTVYDFIE